MEPEEIVRKIELNLSTIDIERSEIEVAYFGGSFTCIDPEQQKKYLDIVQPFIAQGRIKSIRLSTRPDFITEEILDLLKTRQVETIELGVQSMDEDVLQSSGRGHTATDVLKASGLIKTYGFKLGLQMMVGLPGDTAEKSLYTAQRIVDINPDCVRIYPTLVVKNTELENRYNNGTYKALTLEQAVDWVAPVLRLFIQNNINVIRVGLHPSEGLESGEKLVAGPYHPSFKQIVMTRLWYEQFVNFPLENHNDITITVPEAEINNAVGFKAANKNYLKQKFSRVRFNKSSEVRGLEFHVDYH
jgi:histone acetyltransferase (RNA polymerase elongator complex component)